MRIKLLNFFHPFPSVGDTVFWVSAGGIVKKDTFRDNVFCKTKEEAKIKGDIQKMNAEQVSVTRKVLLFVLKINRNIQMKELNGIKSININKIRAVKGSFLLKLIDLRRLK